MRLSDRLSAIRLRSRHVIERFIEKRWVALLLRVGNQTGDDEAGDMAASIAYYSILSIFPLLLGILALLGLFLPSEVVFQQLISFFQRNLPGAVDLLLDNIQAIIRLRGTLGLVSIVGLIWSGSIVFGAISRAVNRAWGIRKRRSFYFRKLRDLVLALSTSILVFFSLAVSAVSVFVPSFDFPFLGALPLIISQFLAGVFIFIAFLLLYKYMPNVRIPWHDTWLGALVATFLFEIARLAFTHYLSHYANYEQVYGSLTSVIIFIAWVYFSSFVFIIGVEFNSARFKMEELEHK